MTTLEVRCCCDASRLLGHIEVAPEDVRPGARLHYRLMQMEPRPRTAAFNPSDTTFQAELLQLEVDWFLPFRGQPTRLAIKDNGATIEQLRRVPGFVEFDSTSHTSARSRP